jgi:hypothetical protein
VRLRCAAQGSAGVELGPNLSGRRVEAPPVGHFEKPLYFTVVTKIPSSTRRDAGCCPLESRLSHGPSSSVLLAPAESGLASCRCRRRCCAWRNARGPAGGRHRRTVWPLPRSGGRPAAMKDPPEACNERLVEVVAPSKVDPLVTKTPAGRRDNGVVAPSKVDPLVTCIFYAAPGRPSCCPLESRPSRHRRAGAPVRCCPSKADSLVAQARPEMGINRCCPLESRPSRRPPRSRRFPLAVVAPSKVDRSSRLGAASPPRKAYPYIR